MAEERRFMAKPDKDFLLLSLILVFSFVYRMFLMFRQTFPPGADIGLHNSIIHSITQAGNTNFLYNYWHMGGGSSVTFPGFHIFTSYVILFTGIPDYAAQAVVVSLFSSLIVVAAYLLTRKVWNAPAALIVAFLMAVSRFDLEMIAWAGYPNVIALMLIPVAFYLFLEKERFSVAPFLVVASLISGAIFLTHSLSALMFVAITVCTVAFTFVFAGRMGERRSGLVMWILPIILGAVSIAPFLLQVVPAYLGADVTTFTGGITAIKQALMATSLLPLEIFIPLLLFVFLYFPFSRYYLGKALALPTILLVMWWLIPTLCTQGQLVGLYTSFNRFLYYVILPLVMLVGFGFYHSARFVGQGLSWFATKAKDLPQVRISKNKTLRRILPHLEEKNFVVVLLLVFILFVFSMVPIFAAPANGIGLQTFYQKMTPALYDSIQWAKASTPENAVFLTDATYGWWFSGFAQRPTLSAVPPEFLTNAREFAPATVASRVLDTDFLIDNGLIQVREDGGYIGRHNPDFYAKLEGKYYPYGFFTFDNSAIVAAFHDGSGSYHKISMSDLKVVDQHMENTSDSASIYVTLANQYINFTEVTTVYRGKLFASYSTSITGNSGVKFDEVDFTLYTTGDYCKGENSTTFGLFNTWDHVAGQIVLTDGQLTTDDLTNSSGIVKFPYMLNGASSMKMGLLASTYAYDPVPKSYTQDEQQYYYQGILADQLEKVDKSLSDAPLDVFNYSPVLAQYNVSYIALRDPDPGQIRRFTDDPKFSLVFINKEVAIFKIVQTRDAIS
jgi:hypothetical protein